MRRIAPLQWAALALMALVYEGHASVTIGGTPEEVREFVEAEPRTLLLRASAEEELAAVAVGINGTIEFFGKDLSEMIAMTEAARNETQTYLESLGEVSELEFATHFKNFSHNLDLTKAKNLTYMTAFSLKLTAFDRVEEIVAALSKIEGVGVNDYSVEFEDAEETKNALRERVWKQIERQKREYESNLELSLEVVDFRPFDDFERGGGVDDEVFELSPFSVSANQRRLRLKKRSETIALERLFPRKAVRQYLEVIYRIAPDSGNGQ